MADAKSVLEREYIIPLRKIWMKVPEYKRTGKAIKAIKQFITRHMKVTDRDLSKVKLDVFFNNELWFRGRRHPPAKIKVKATKENDLVKVTFVEIPQHIKFLQARLEKRHKSLEKKPEKKLGEAKYRETKPEEKTESEKKEEKEKEKAVAEVRAKESEMQAKAQKHLTAKKEPGFHRMALKK